MNAIEARSLQDWRNVARRGSGAWVYYRGIDTGEFDTSSTNG